MRKIVIKIEDDVTDEQATLMANYAAKALPFNFYGAQMIDRFEPFIIYVVQKNSTEITISKKLKI